MEWLLGLVSIRLAICSYWSVAPFVLVLKLVLHLRIRFSFTLENSVIFWSYHHHLVLVHIMISWWFLSAKFSLQSNCLLLTFIYNSTIRIFIVCFYHQAQRSFSWFMFFHYWSSCQKVFHFIVFFFLFILVVRLISWGWWHVKIFSSNNSFSSYIICWIKCTNSAMD